MNKIDTNKWSEFSVEYLFRVLKCSKKVGQKETNEEGKVPVYSSESLNNGIVGYCNLEPTWIVDPKNPLYLIFGDHTRTFHIADSSFCVADNVKVLLPLHAEMSVKVLQFISSVWQKEIPNLGYSRHWSAAKKVRILLPSKDGVPDWQYMEDYMRNIELRVQSSISAFNAAKYGLTSINTNYWKEFTINELFRIVKGKRLTKANMVAGEINYIGATAFNNGVSAKIGNTKYLHPAGTITVCYNGSIGQTFYQEQPFWASDDVNVLYPKFKISKYIAHFICPIIYKISLNYAYVDKWTADKMRVSKILLPAKGNEPDWHYMEMYMRGVEAIVKNKLSLLIPHKPELTIQDAASITFNGANVTYIDNSKNYSVEK